MKKLFATAGLAAAITLSGLAQASPTTYEFSYTFGTGDVASGTFTGDANGALITVLSDVVVYLNGVPLDTSWTGYLLSERRVDNHHEVGGAVVALAGVGSNFLFAEQEIYQLVSLTNDLFGIHSHPLYTYVHMQVDGSPFLSEDFNPTRWSVAAERADNVPEPATLALLSLGIAGLGFSRRKR